ncbi:hypothetical protein AVEN_262439-1 [Araneus ventricosus]|uniref:Uncharacterized protein n=1 Tax=Araneus ventricosus TaxID=182803 RepID=A0A4Y2RFQ5_ARAVE|nr:hypothetical protein AVEN_262439-1 [Araneus ventricosus]
MKAEWHFFFPSCHGKGACDDIGGTIKCMASKASLQRPYKNQILNASDLYKFTKDSINGIKTFFVEKSEIEISHCQLAMRYQTVDAIKGTRSNHSFVPINETQLLVSRVSDSTTKFIASLGSKTIPLSPQNEQYVCTYGIKWWIGKIVECYDEYNDYKIMFMHPHGPSALHMWLKPLDACWIPYEHIMKIVSAPSTNTGRTYKITPEEDNSIELLFKNFKMY